MPDPRWPPAGALLAYFICVMDWADAEFENIAVHQTSIYIVVLAVVIATLATLNSLFTFTFYTNSHYQNTSFHDTYNCNCVMQVLPSTALIFRPCRIDVAYCWMSHVVLCWLYRCAVQKRRS